MAASAENRKRFASPIVNDELFGDLAKRGRYTAPCPVQALDALRGIFPDATPSDLEACFAASGAGDIQATVQANRGQQQALASRLAQGGVDEFAGVLVEQMAAATDARNRASWILGLVNSADAAEGIRLREENAVLRGEAARLTARAAAAEQDNALLKRGLLAVLKEYM